MFSEGSHTRWLSGRYYVFTLSSQRARLPARSRRHNALLYAGCLVPILLETPDRCVSCNSMISKPDKPANGNSLADSLGPSTVSRSSDPCAHTDDCAWLVWLSSRGTPADDRAAYDLRTTRVTTQDRSSYLPRTIPPVNVTKVRTRFGESVPAACGGKKYGIGVNERRAARPARLTLGEKNRTSKSRLAIVKTQTCAFVSVWAFPG